MSQEKGYRSREEKILNSIQAFLENSDWTWTPLSDLKGFMDDLDYSNHETWTGLNRLSAGGMIESIDRAERTYLRSVGGYRNPEEVPDYDSISENGEDWTKLIARSDWWDIGETRVPALDTRLFQDFLERHGYGDSDSQIYTAEHTEAVVSYDQTAAGDKEYWRIVVNDEAREEDRMAVTVLFQGDDSVFQPRHRQNYAEEVWTPLLVLQQRNAWVNRASRKAVENLGGLKDSWEDLTGEDLGVEEAYLKELGSLTDRERGYEDMRESVVENYYGEGDLRPSRVLLPYSSEMENRLVGKAVRERPLPAGGEEGEKKGPVLLDRHLDSLYQEARARS